MKDYISPDFYREENKKKKGHDDTSQYRLTALDDIKNDFKINGSSIFSDNHMNLLKFESIENTIKIDKNRKGEEINNQIKNIS